MISELTLQEINSMQPTFLTKSKKLGYTCPVCSNGQGPDGTGITKIRNVDIWSCRNCGTSKNIIAWYMVQNNLRFVKTFYAFAYAYILAIYKLYSLVFMYICVHSCTISCPKFVRAVLDTLQTFI